MSHYRSIEEQAKRLPLFLQDYYKTTLIDRITIDGNEINGYFEYSYMLEKSYFENPTRSLAGTIDNLDSYATFLTPRLVVKYNMMHIDDYRKFMLLMQSKNEFSVTCYDIVLDKRVTHNMYIAPTSMPNIYHRNLEVLGVKEYTIELIGTNTGVESYKITYDYNIPSEHKAMWQSNNYETSATQDIPMNTSDIVGAENAQYTLQNAKHNLSSINPNFENAPFKDYIFQGWCVDANGDGFVYVDGNAYFFSADMTLYAKWVKTSG